MTTTRRTRTSKPKAAHSAEPFGSPGVPENPSPADDDEAAKSIREWARLKSARMFELLESIAEDSNAPTPSRVAAAQTIIEHGHGKAAAAQVVDQGRGPGPAEHKPDLASLRERAQIGTEPKLNGSTPSMTTH
jgi:hypothetical protein